MVATLKAKAVPAPVATSAPSYSVVMPAHRDDAWLAAALHSIEAAIAGSSSEAELIVVANGPERDWVAAAVRQLATLPRTRVLVCDAPTLGECLNRGIEAAQGEWIARADADDLCLPGRFAHQIKVAGKSGADFVFGAARDIDDQGRPLNHVRSSSTSLWNLCGPVGPTAFMRRSALLALGGYGRLDAGEDYHLWLQAGAGGYRLHADGDAVIAYRRHPQQATARIRMASLFANNVRTKLALAARTGSPALAAGALLDACRFAYRRCADVFC